MSYVSFYRKWRPQTFTEIIGQEHIVQTLQNSILKNRISHSYIFCGPRGTGKTSLARIFAKALNCINGPTPYLCNKCDNCVSISTGANVDVIEIDAASNRGIDDIRDLREKVKYLPTNLRKKIYIIDEAHQITSAASNAFLKVLEEPPEHVIFIMATTEPHEVIPTIMSRCQRFDFEPIKIDKIKKRLSDIARIEGIDINESAINLIAKYADGSLRDADGILEQISSFKDSKITVDDITSLLGIIDQEMLFEFANILLEKNINQGLLFIKRILESGLNLKIFVTEFLEHLYNLYVIKNYENPLDILDINEDFRDRCFNQARLFNVDEIEKNISLFSELLIQIKWGEGSKTFFKTTVIKAFSTESFDDGEMASRLKKVDLQVESLKRMIEAAKIKDVAFPENRNDPTDTLKTDKKQIKKSETDIESDTLKLKSTSKSKPTDNIKMSGTKNDYLKDFSKTPEKKKDVENIKSEDINKSKDDEDLIIKNWDLLLSYLKEKNISIQAMFKEAKSLKIMGNLIYFYLDENKKWHKEHLNKTNNLTLLQEAIKKITGKNYRVIFESNEALAEKNNVLIKENKQTHQEEKNEDIYDYIEGKFNIKKKA